MNIQRPAQTSVHRGKQFYDKKLPQKEIWCFLIVRMYHRKELFASLIEMLLKSLASNKIDWYSIHSTLLIDDVCRGKRFLQWFWPYFDIILTDNQQFTHCHGNISKYTSVFGPISWLQTELDELWKNSEGFIHSCFLSQNIELSRHLREHYLGITLRFHSFIYHLIDYIVR